MTAVLVSGVIANKYLNGGAVWTRLNWILGLRRLGFDVYFVEQIARDACRDAAGSITAFDECENLSYFKAISRQFGLDDKSSLIYDDGAQVHGLRLDEIEEVADSAAFLVNISGHLALDRVRRRVRCSVYVDLDPGFTQFWHASGNLGARLANHEHYYTVGENIGRDDCSIPVSGIDWRPICQPVVLDEWPVSSEGARDRFTTIASWRGAFGPVEHGGKTFGVKVHEFRKFLGLPDRLPASFEIALDIHEADSRDRQALADHRWTLTDPKVAVPNPDAFRRYVQTSGAEFSVAQGIYTETNSGWFSDRTVRYLASGKPALVQDTGFSRTYPVGDGLVPFRTLDEAVSGAERVLHDYDEHCTAARRLAEEYFDSKIVLGRLVNEIDV
jgi:hypothetical protein